MKKENHPIDALFRESLKGLEIEPSPASMGRFLEAAAKKGPGGTAGLFTRMNLLILAGIVVTGIALYLFLLKDNARPEMVNENAVQAPVPELSGSHASLTASANTTAVSTQNSKTVASAPNTVRYPIATVHTQKPTVRSTNEHNRSLKNSAELPGLRSFSPSKKGNTDPYASNEASKAENLQKFSPGTVPFTVGSAKATVYASNATIPSTNATIPKSEKSILSGDIATISQEEDPVSGESSPAARDITKSATDAGSGAGESAETGIKKPSESEFSAEIAADPNGQKNKEINNVKKNKRGSSGFRSKGQGATPGKQEEQSRRPEPWMFEPALLYTFDLNFDNATGTGQVHTLGMEGVLRKGRFFAELRSGWSFTRGYHQYDIEYNPYLGNYQRLDSMSFVYDSSGYNLVPVYRATSTVDVWDSTILKHQYEVQGRYNVLTIPLLVGYDVYHRNRLNFSLKAGLETQWFLGSRYDNLDYISGNDRVIGIHPKDDPMARNNFWLTGGFSASYLLTRRLLIEAEPRMRYYLNPPEVSPGNTFSPSIRAAVKLKF